MRIFLSRRNFAAQMSGIKKWGLALQALEGANQLPQGVAYSIGDSLTYWWDKAARVASSYWIGHRRYMAVIAPIEGEVLVGVRSKDQLIVRERYSDVSDREIFENGKVDSDGDVVGLKQGNILIVGSNEAYRFFASPAKVVILHVTVEGISFPNKSE